MSDQSPPGNPYGEPVNPYGQPAQPTSYGQVPTYGQPPAYGEMPAYGQPVSPDKRPGTVTAAAAVTLGFSVITLLLFVLATVALSVERDSFLAEIDSEPGLEDVSPDDLFAVMMIVFAVLMVWSLSAIVLAILVLRRSNVARIMLIISAAVTGLLSLLLILSVISVVTLVAGVAVVVLLLTSRAREWFSSKDAPPTLPIGTTQPWG